MFSTQKKCVDNEHHSQKISANNLISENINAQFIFWLLSSPCNTQVYRVYENFDWQAYIGTCLCNSFTSFSKNGWFAPFTTKSCEWQHRQELTTKKRCKWLRKKKSFKGMWHAKTSKFQVEATAHFSFSNLFVCGKQRNKSSFHLDFRLAQLLMYFLTLIWVQHRNEYFIEFKLHQLILR